MHLVFTVVGSKCFQSCFLTLVTMILTWLTNVVMELAARTAKWEIIRFSCGFNILDAPREFGSSVVVVANEESPKTAI